MMAKKTKEELEALIEDETRLINSLEADKDFGGLTKCQHETSIKDAYWRRRNWRSQLEGGPNVVQIFSSE